MPGRQPPELLRTRKVRKRLAQFADESRRRHLERSRAASLAISANLPNDLPLFVTESVKVRNVLLRNNPRAS